MYDRFLAAAILFLVFPTGSAEELPATPGDAFEGHVIGEVVIDNADIFDLSNPEEDRWLYRAANRYHIVTRKKTISHQLLFKPGDAFDKRLVEESERILRANKYLYDAHIEVKPAGDGKVDITVRTRDVWSLVPEFSYSRSGGKSRSRMGLEEINLLGRGQMLRFLHDNDVDRDENTIEFSNPDIGHNRLRLLARYSNNSDGDSHLFNLTRPFYALDTRRALGGNIMADDRRSKLYQFGEEAAEYRHERDYFYLFGGWSRGLRDGETKRWTTGVVFDDNRFTDVPTSTLPSVVPANRKLVYPFVGFELVEDGFVTTQNRDQIERTEDFQMGLHVRASLGWADTSFGADRDAAILSAQASRGFGSFEKNALLLSAETSGRVESGNLANALFTMETRYYRKQSKKRTFYVGISGTAGKNLDLDNPVEIGGDSGLRGYPLRYQAGESRVLATIEQRFFTDWYPFRFARIGGAMFADVGRVWGPNPLGPDNRGWLADVGFGFRFAMTRFATGRIIHLDVAFPLNSDPDIDSVQILIEGRRTF